MLATEIRYNASHHAGFMIMERNSFVVHPVTRRGKLHCHSICRSYLLRLMYTHLGLIYGDPSSVFCHSGISLIAERGRESHVIGHVISLQELERKRREVRSWRGGEIALGCYSNIYQESKSIAKNLPLLKENPQQQPRKDTDMLVSKNPSVCLMCGRASPTGWNRNGLKEKNNEWQQLTVVLTSWQAEGWDKWVCQVMVNIQNISWLKWTECKKR